MRPPRTPEQACSSRRVRLRFNVNTLTLAANRTGSIGYLCPLWEFAAEGWVARGAGATFPTLAVVEAVV